MKTIRLYLLCAVLLSVLNLSAAELKIGYVNVNLVINQSISGQKSKKVLEVTIKQSEESLRKKEQVLQKLQQELNSSIPLKAEVKRQKQQEFQRLAQEFQAERVQLNQSIQREERRHTENIYKDLKVLIQDYAKRKNYDLVLEFALYSTILYAKENMVDITTEIITEYDKLAAE